MIIFFGCDHAGLELKKQLMLEAVSMGLEVRDLGVHSPESVDYPDIAKELVGKLLGAPEDSRGCLICGTGIGMSIAANRFKGVRAAVCYDGEKSAYFGRAHNNANILCLGARIISQQSALACLRTFILTPFEGGRHIQRIEKIDSLS